MLSFHLRLKESTYRDLVVQAPDLHTALDIAYERWAGADTGESTGGQVLVLDENGNQVDVLADW